MAPLHKSSWLAVLFVFTLAVITKAAAVGSTAVRAEPTDAGVGVPDLVSVESDSKVATAEVNNNNDADEEEDAAYEPTNLTPAAGRPQKCKKILRRQDWKDMSKNDRLSYINAVKCLQRLEPNIGIPFARSRFDEFQGLHITLMTQVHLVGQFLPWHRLLMHFYEKTLNDECDYAGAQPYWDWTHDYENFLNAAVFDPVYGFGSLPRQHRAPITDGPFANYSLVFGTGAAFNLTDHIIERGYNASQLKYISPSEVKRISSLPDFEQFRVQLEGYPVTSEPRPHDGGHYAVGGEMGDFWSSPGDPLFYLHHANLDRIWWKWQKADPSHLYAISGRATEVQSAPFKNVTLDFLLPLGNLSDPTPLRDVMETEKSFCYTYV